MNRNGDTTSFQLDAITVNLLVRLAEMWGVSEDEAVRRAVVQANAMIGAPTKEGRWEAFQELQRSLNLTPARAAEWQNAVREARR